MALSKDELKQARQSLLQQAFARAKLTNPRFSLRSLALKMNLSPAFVSKVMSGKVDLPLERVETFAKALKFDDLNNQEMLKTYQPSGLIASAPGKNKSLVFGQYEEISGTQHDHFLTQWYYLAILDLVSCRPEAHTTKSIARRLGLDLRIAKNAVELLLQSGFLSKNEQGFYMKTQNKMRFSTTLSRLSVRNYHSIMMKKAIQVMQSRTSERDFAKRLIAGLSISVDSKKVEEVRTRLHQFLYEIAEELSQGDTNEVYQLALQFFPVSES